MVEVLSVTSVATPNLLLSVPLLTWRQLLLPFSATKVRQPDLGQMNFVLSKYYPLAIRIGAKVHHTVELIFGMRGNGYSDVRYLWVENVFAVSQAGHIFI